MDEEKIQEILDAIKKESFVDSSSTSNEEAMGILISKFFHYRGLPIMESACYAFEDANYHDMANGLESLWETTE